MNGTERPTIHYSELKPLPPDSELYTEYEVYRREVGRLLAEGHEGKWVLIHGEDIVGMFDTRDQALDVRSERYFGQAGMVKQILTREPLLRYFPRYNWTAPDSPESLHYTQLPPTPPDSLFFTERELYRREVARLIAEGHEGKWLVIQGDSILGMFDTKDQALTVRAQRLVLGRPVMLQQILTREPVLKITPRYI